MPPGGSFCGRAISATLATVGSLLGRLHTLYPDATRPGGSGFEQRWVLEPGALPCKVANENGEAEGLQATTIGDHVDHLDVYYFALGE